MKVSTVEIFKLQYHSTLAIFRSDMYDMNKWSWAYPIWKTDTCFSNLTVSFTCWFHVIFLRDSLCNDGIENWKPSCNRLITLLQKHLDENIETSLKIFFVFFFLHLPILFVYISNLRMGAAMRVRRCTLQWSNVYEKNIKLDQLQISMILNYLSNI